MLSQDILANINNDQDYQRWIEQESTTDNYDSPYGVSMANNNNMMSAQLTSDVYMKLKQRSPMTIQYYAAPGSTTPKSITMYINPSKMEFINQKIIGKSITRGGIFYNHYGPDNTTLQISGTTGLSGMKGIKQLEEMYYASGTILRYQNYMPTQVNGDVKDFKTIDYSDPISIAQNVVNNNYSNDKVDIIQQQMFNNSQDNTNSKSKISRKIQINQVNNIIEITKSNQQISKFISNDLPKIKDDIEKCDSYAKAYNLALKEIRDSSQNMSDEIVAKLAYSISINKKVFKSANIDNKNVTDSLRTGFNEDNIINFVSNRSDVIKQCLSEIKDFDQRNTAIDNYLYAAMTDMQQDMTDPWLPRQLIIYFENCAYIGFFKSFTYDREASQPNYITYSLAFNITRQYEFNDTSVDANISSSIKLPSNSQSSSNNSSNNLPNKSLYTVKAGDNLDKIAKLYYGDETLWPEIYAANMSIISNPNLITPNMQLVIPNISGYISQYYTWVVLDNDNLSSIAERFYGNEDKWQQIYNYNKNIIGNDPNKIYPRTILKIPRV